MHGISNILTQNIALLDTDAHVERDETYVILHPQSGGIPFVLNSPHSGEAFPQDFLDRSQLPRAMLRRASDLFVDHLVMPLAGDGATIMHAELPRSFLDLNREPFELDPRLIAGPMPPEANTRSLRVVGGLGTIPRVIGDQTEIYAGKITLEEASARIERYYLPYHKRLHQLLASLHARYGHVILLDCHSMPSTGGPRPGGLMPDFVLGDRFGTSCAPRLMGAFESILQTQGFRVARNQPYAGGYITEYYGRPASGWHALQIEINRSLYMDERSLEPHAGFVDIAVTLQDMLRQMFTVELFENHTGGLHFHQRAAE